MNVEQGELGGIRLAAFSKSKSTKSEQFQQLKALDSTSCVICRVSSPKMLSYLELTNDREVLNGSDMRIWYFICSKCLMRTPALALRTTLLDQIKNQKN